MTEKYTGKLHHMKEVARSRWDEVKEQGGPREMVRSSFIRRVNAGESYDHHYRRKSRFQHFHFHSWFSSLISLQARARHHLRRCDGY